VPDPRDRGAVPGLRFAILSQRWIILMLPHESQIAGLAPETPETHRRLARIANRRPGTGDPPETQTKPTKTGAPITVTADNFG